MARKPESTTPDGASLSSDPGDVDADLPGIISEIGSLPPGAMITEEGLATIFGKCIASVKNAIDRGELPPPVKFMGKYTWTARKIIEFHEARLEAEARKISRLHA